MYPTPDFVQKVYDRVLSDGLPGSNADANPTYDYSFIAETDTIPFGTVISLGSSYGPPVRARLGNAGAHSAAAGYATGTGTPDTTIANWVAITNGQFEIIINDVLLRLESMDFSSVTTMAEVATVIQTAIRAYTSGGTPFTSATCTWVLDTTGNQYQFRITAGTTATACTFVNRDSVGAGTDILVMLGMDSVLYTPATPLVSSATVLGVVIRSLTEQGQPAPQSNVTAVYPTHIGAFRKAGNIKVLCNDNCTAGAQVYYNGTTGLIYGSSSGNVALGTSKFASNYSQGQVGIINISGL